MIAVCDVNAIWRHRPFSAMAEFSDVLAFAPCDWIRARQRTPWPTGALDVIDVILPPSWASKTAWVGQRLLWHRMQSEARQRKKDITCVVVTSPHYHTLLNLLPGNVKTIYYASDDFRSYIGWNNMAALEEKVVQRVDHAFFISEALVRRAREEYSVSPDKISVSMNGTEERFYPSPDEQLPVEPPDASLKRPIAGVVGGIGDRLDFDLLRACADLPETGTLLLVGPLPEERSESLQRLLAHPKCASTGIQSHESIHLWFKTLDVGLMPYVESEFNAFCSPMRLFDHLATGCPIVSTKACDQAQVFSSVINVCADQQEFVSTVAQVIAKDFKDKAYSARCETAKQQSWPCRARSLLNIINGL